MDFDEYQDQAMRTAAFGVHIETIALGLCEEAGEVAGVIKKANERKLGIVEDKVLEELGDVLWYVARMCDHYGVPLKLVAQRNIDKLKKRHPEGFKP